MNQVADEPGGVRRVPIFMLPVFLKLRNTDFFAAWFAVTDVATPDGIRVVQSVLGAISSLSNVAKPYTMCQVADKPGGVLDCLNLKTFPRRPLCTQPTQCCTPPRIPAPAYPAPTPALLLPSSHTFSTIHHVPSQPYTTFSTIHHVQP